MNPETLITIAPRLKKLTVIKLAEYFRLMEQGFVFTNEEFREFLGSEECREIGREIFLQEHIN